MLAFYHFLKSSDNSFISFMLSLIYHSQYLYFLCYIIIMINPESPSELVLSRIKQHGPPYKIEQLCLDQIPLIRFSPQLTPLVQKCLRVEYISLCDCQLASLINFPFLPNLQLLQLTHNQLIGEHLQPLSKFSKLYSLALDFNKIIDLSWVRFLKRNRISALSLKGNPVCSQPEFRERTYRALGADLQILDGIDRKGNIAAESDSSQSQDVSEQDEQDFKMNQSQVREEQNESEESLQENSVSIQSDIQEEEQGESSKKIKKNENQSQ